MGAWSFRLHVRIFGIAPNTIQCEGRTDPSHAAYPDACRQPSLVDNQANVGTSDASAATYEHRLSNLFTCVSQQNSAMQHSAFPHLI